MQQLAKISDGVVLDLFGLSAPIVSTDVPTDALRIYRCSNCQVRPRPVLQVRGVLNGSSTRIMQAEIVRMWQAVAWATVLAYQ